MKKEETSYDTFIKAPLCQQGDRVKTEYGWATIDRLRGEGIYGTFTVILDTPRKINGGYTNVFRAHIEVKFVLHTYEGKEGRDYDYSRRNTNSSRHHVGKQCR